jgi:8-oxo-dGTP diphosphatase
MAIGRFLGGVAAVIWSPANEKYLLLRRSPDKDYARGVWECVTGRVDQGEGFEEAVHREVGEELGVAVRVDFIIGTTHFYRGSARPENELIGVVFGCTIQDPDAIRISAEHSELRWVTAADAEVLLDAADPSTRWIRRVILRADAIRQRLPPELLAYLQQASFELG